MPGKFGQPFRRARRPLASGGVFDFDAVSADNKVVASISTSGATTASGKHGVGKLLKIRSDMYFLLLADAERRLVVLTEKDMHELLQKEKDGGRVPTSIEFFHAEIPEHLGRRLQEARGMASREVSPRSSGGGA